MSTNSNNKRADAAEHERAELEPKRQRRGFGEATINGGEDPQQRGGGGRDSDDDATNQERKAEYERQQSEIDAEIAKIDAEIAEKQRLREAKQRERVANGAIFANLKEQLLERQRKAILAGIESKKEEFSQVQRDLARMESELEMVDARLASVKEEPEKAERQRRRLETASSENTKRIEDCMRTLKSGTLRLDFLLEHDFPDLIDNLDFWWALLDEGGEIHRQPAVAAKILCEKTPPTVLNCRKLMLQLCSKNFLLYVAIPSDCSLKTEPVILEVMLAKNPYAVVIIPGPVQVQSSQLIGKALARLPLWHATTNDRVKDNVDTDVWANRDVVLGWLKGGGHWHEDIPESLREDEEILLAAMTSKQPYEFLLPTIPNGLKRELDFMKKAVERNPDALNYVAENLKESTDLAVAAASGTHGVLAVTVARPGFLTAGGVAWHHGMFWSKVNYDICQKLAIHDSFVKLVLGSIHFPDDKPSTFAALDQGKETSLATKKLIAKFAGVPVGEELGKLRSARKNFAKSGYPFME